MTIKTYYHDNRGYVSVPCKEVKRVKFGKLIKQHALGDIHRLNAKTSDCYAFSYYGLNEAKNTDFEGGWDWINDLVDKNAEFILELSTGKFYKILWNLQMFN